MLIVKGVNVYPQAIQNAIVAFAPRVTGHFRIRLPEPGPLVRPPLRLAIEHGAGLGSDDVKRLEREIASGAGGAALQPVDRMARAGEPAARKQKSAPDPSRE